MKFVKGSKNKIHQGCKIKVKNISAVKSQKHQGCKNLKLKIIRVIKVKNIKTVKY